MSVRSARLWWLGLGITVIVAAAATWIASAEPDGLERVAEDHGFADAAEPHALEGSPVADYELDGVDDPGWSGGLAGVLGVAVTLAVGGGVLWLLRRPTVDPASGDGDREQEPAPTP